MVFPFSTDSRTHVILSGLATYSKIGGLQQFNRRLVRNLAARAQDKRTTTEAIGLFYEDRATVPPNIEGMTIDTSERNRVFAFKTLWTTVTKGDVLLIAHINLLPLAALIRCLRPRMPIILFVHGIEVWNLPTFRRRKWYEPLLVKCLTRVASVSQFTADIMAREFRVPKSKFRLLPNAVDSGETPATLPAASPGKPAGTPTILSVARLNRVDRAKNFDKVIRAVALFSERLPQVRYEIVGDGDLRPELEALARELKIDHQIHFLGRLSDTELASAYERASVFIMPSTKEGFGIVYLEAWQHGVPVICADVGAPKELIDDGVDGFAVDPENIEMVADRLERILSDKERSLRMGANGRHKVETRYSNASFRANLDQILDEVLEASPSKKMVAHTSK